MVYFDHDRTKVKGKRIIRPCCFVVAINKEKYLKFFVFNGNQVIIKIMPLDKLLLDKIFNSVK